MGGESRGGAVSIIGSCIAMITLQGLLLIIHRSGTSRPRSGQPSAAELFVGITIFWAFQRCIGRILAGIGVILSIGLSEFAANDRGRQGNHHYASLGIEGLGLRQFWVDLASLFEMVLITWSFHFGLIFVLDTAIPFCHELRQSPQKSLQKVHERVMEIFHFLEFACQAPFSGLSDETLGRLPDEIFNAKGQAIHLERRQTEHPNEGQRRLSWNIVVDEDAMDEMKETLGPPGGFGELGFNVARDGVRFEAMGVGTSFNLMFKLREDETDGKLERGSKGKQE